MRFGSTSPSVIGRTTPMGLGTGTGVSGGTGFRAITAGVIIIGSGFPAITRRVRIVRPPRDKRRPENSVRLSYCRNESDAVARTRQPDAQ